MIRNQHSTLTTGREQGGELLLSLIILVLLLGLSVGQFAITRSNIRQSDFYAGHNELSLYAQTGCNLALHDLCCNITGLDGMVGTTSWTIANDLGMDGLSGTNDKGEGDGVPTPGETNVTMTNCGDGFRNGMGLMVYTQDTGYANVKRITATAASDNSEPTVETYVMLGVDYLPRLGAIWLEPGRIMEAKGDEFMVSGVDMDPDGTVGALGDEAGISTNPGDPAGSNATDIVDQIKLDRVDQVVGVDGQASVTEMASDLEFVRIFKTLEIAKEHQVAPGTYSKSDFGAPGSPTITHVEGDLHLSGTAQGHGVLVVDGNLKITGEYQFFGLIIVKGDTMITGGGEVGIIDGANPGDEMAAGHDDDGFHLFGSLMVSGDLTMAGNARVQYSSATLGIAEGLLKKDKDNWFVLYWDGTRR